jgi:hypothetical protein
LQYLPLAFHAYLTWFKRWEIWRKDTVEQEPPRLYVAAPVDSIAIFLGAIVQYLPRPFYRDLTFSTFESNLSSKNGPLFIGTCWLPDARGAFDSSLDLPTNPDKQDVVLNCYQNAPQHKVQFDPDPTINLIAANAARDMLDYKIMGDKDLAALSHSFETRNDLSLAEFLQAYKQSK